jgi:hypothetical protein
MQNNKFRFVVLVSIILGSLEVAALPFNTAPASVPAQNPVEQQVVTKGLTWLVKAQHQDGHWEGNGGNYPTSLTALAGLSLLMEGSTPFEGKFKKELKRAVSWLVEQSRQNGLLTSNHPSESGRYMYSQGFALLFLANVYSRCAPEKKPQPQNVEEAVLWKKQIKLRGELEPVLKRAVKFTVAAQNQRGGWYYVAAAETSGSDEMNITALQLQALEAARAAGIAVPAAATDLARKHLDASIPVHDANPFGSKPLAKQPPAVAAALAAVLSTAELGSPMLEKWLLHCPKEAHGIPGFDIETYFHFHYAQVMYHIGDTGYAKLFPDAKERLTWSAYRQKLWKRLRELQQNDGSWSHQVGPVYATASYLVALQLEAGRVPFFRQGKWAK